MGINNPLITLGLNVGRGIVVEELKKRGNKLIKQDANSTGKDDAAGRALLAIAEAVAALELTDNINSLSNIGKALEAAGRQIQVEIDNIQK